jgi:hypothetical protein
VNDHGSVAYPQVRLCNLLTLINKL